MNERRTKSLAIAAGAVLLFFLADKGYAAFWSEPWAKAKADIAAADAELARAKGVLAREAQVQEEWRKLRGLLAKRPESVGTHLVSHLDGIFDRSGVKADISSGNSQQLPGADFREYIFETRFKLPWGSFVDLLVELHNSREFLKPLRLNVSSQYEREDRLDVDLKVSTIEYAPQPAKPGAK